MRTVVSAPLNLFAKIAVAAAFLLACTFSASAQAWEHFNLGVGGGFTTPVEEAGSQLNYGWNVDVRGGAQVNDYLLTDLDFTYTNMRFNDTTLANFGEPNGGLGIWSLTFQPILRAAPRISKVQPYVTGGFGLYHMSLTLTQPANVPTIFCGGFFGCFPAVVGTNQVVASNSVYKPGFNGGIGFTIPVGADRKAGFFAEARYHEMFMSNAPNIRYVPVTFGFHW